MYYLFSFTSARCCCDTVYFPAVGLIEDSFVKQVIHSKDTDMGLHLRTFSVLGQFLGVSAFHLA